MKTTGMPEYSDPDAAPAAPDDAMQSNEDCIPLSALAMPDADNGDKMANPAVGDHVGYQVEGSVTRIEGDNAYVKRESVNGQPVDEQDEAAAAGDDEAQERGELGDMAGQMGGLP
jgi:hypothetical protein